MKKALFRPFDISKWFVLGFTAFLAGLTRSGNGGSSGSRIGNGTGDWDKFFRLPGKAREWFIDNPMWFTLIVFGIFLAIAIAVLITWLSSRGKFMFLDNVINDKAEVIKPWYRFRVLGNSLFLWHIAYGFIVFFVFITLLILAFSTLYGMHRGGAPRATMIAAVAGFGIAAGLIALISAYISHFLTSFVVPIMYRNDVKTIEGWRRFLSLFKVNAVYFLGFGLLMFVLHILVFIAVMVFGLFTCLIGFILLIIPYIGSVVLLPVSYTFRAFSVEFLGQFGHEYSLFERDEPEAEGPELGDS